jgi:hypothetical protein
VAQINALEQQKRNIEIAIAELPLASRILGENPRREAPPTFRPSTWH